MLFDLSESNSVQDLYTEVKEHNYLDTGLINNAGFGDYGNFNDMSLKKNEKMIAVNVTALVGLTKLFGADMVKAGNGRIMNVASFLSFLPLPYYSVYSATVSYTHLRAHETVLDLVCRLLLEKKKKNTTNHHYLVSTKHKYCHMTTTQIKCYHSSHVTE